MRIKGGRSSRGRIKGARNRRSRRRGGRSRSRYKTEEREKALLIMKALTKLDGVGPVDNRPSTD